MAKVSRLMADDAPDDDRRGKSQPTQSTSVPNLMDRVRLEHEMDRIKRERDRKQKGLENRIKQSQRDGRPIPKTVIKIQRQQINGLTIQVEEILQKILKMDEES